MQLLMSWYIISFFGFIFTSNTFFIFSSNPVLTSSIDVVFVLSIRRYAAKVACNECYISFAQYSNIILIYGSNADAIL